MALLLILTAVMYLWNITINAMGNQFYAGAAQAGSKDWEALLFGSLDAQNFITVDKPPVSQWVMGLSGQIFGFSSASMLVPEALMAVTTVALLYAVVRRISGPNTALLAGGALALTPVAALMFRFNNPDAVMVLLMTAAAYCAVRALEHASARWIALAGVALGFAFLAKMLEGIMVLPAIGLVYLIAAPTSVGRRLLQLAGALVAFLVSAGWFVVLTLLWPSSSRPYIAGSTDNNFMNLVLGYNGFARVLGKNHQFASPSIAGASAGTKFRLKESFDFMGDQVEGLRRLFTGEFGFEIGWLLPGALVAGVLVIVARGRAARTDPVRAGAILFGVWVLVDGLVLSFMHTKIPPYYCMSLAPAAAALFAIGVHEMWGRRSSWLGRIGLTSLVAVTGVWSWWLLGNNGEWLPPLRWTVLVLTLGTAGLLLFPFSERRGRWAPAVLAVGVIAAMAGSASYAIATIGQPHTGPMVMAGPASNQFGQRSPGQWLNVANPQLDALLRGTHTRWSAAILRSSSAASLELSSGTSVMAIGGFPGNDPVPTLQQFQDDVANHRIGYYVDPVNLPGPGLHGYGGQQHADIAHWVQNHFSPIKVGSTTVYDLAVPTPRAGT